MPYDQLASTSYTSIQATSEKPKIMNYRIAILVGLVYALSMTPITWAAEKVDSNAALKAHNAERSKVGAPSLKWSPKLEATAMAYAQKMEASGNCFSADHNANRGANVGENMSAAAGSVAAPQPPEKAVAGWVSEKQNYDYDANTCAPGKSCGHYTQVVWSSSTEVGCAVASCENDPQTGWFSTQLVCDYSPAGNMKGEKPY